MTNVKQQEFFGWNIMAPPLLLVRKEAFLGEINQELQQCMQNQVQDRMGTDCWMNLTVNVGSQTDRCSELGQTLKKHFTESHQGQVIQ